MGFLDILLTGAVKGAGVVNEHIKLQEQVRHLIDQLKERTRERNDSGLALIRLREKANGYLTFAPAPASIADARAREDLRLAVNIASGPAKISAIALGEPTEDEVISIVARAFGWHEREVASAKWRRRFVVNVTKPDTTIFSTFTGQQLLDAVRLALREVLHEGLERGS